MDKEKFGRIRKCYIGLIESEIITLDVMKSITVDQIKSTPISMEFAIELYKFKYPDADIDIDEILEISVDAYQKLECIDDALEMSNGEFDVMEEILFDDSMLYPESLVTAATNQIEYTDTVFQIFLDESLQLLEEMNNKNNSTEDLKPIETEPQVVEYKFLGWV